MSDTALAQEPVEPDAAVPKIPANNDDAALQQQSDALEGSGARKIAKAAGRQPDAFIINVKDDAGYEALAPNAKFKGPDGGIRTKPISNDDEYDALPEGAQFIDPQGQSRTKPKFEGLNYTAQTLTNMAVNDKEREKILNSYGGGKVKKDSKGFYVEDEGGVLRRSKGFQEAPGSFLTAHAAPIVGSIAGEIGGGIAGSVLPGPGNIAGAVIGGAGGAAYGHAFNSLMMQLFDVRDRTVAEDAGEAGLASLFGGVGSAVGRVASKVVPSMAAAENVMPRLAAKALGTDAERLGTAIPLMEAGVEVPAKSVYPHAPALSNIQTYGTAFRQENPQYLSQVKHYEESTGKILDELGVKSPETVGPLKPGEKWQAPGTISKPAAAVSTQDAGEAIQALRISKSQQADLKLQQALQDHQRAVITGSGDLKERQTALKAAADDKRNQAQKLLDLGLEDIQKTINEAMAATKAGHNSGDIWWMASEKLQAARAALGARAKGEYDDIYIASGGHSPNSAGLPELASQFLDELPTGFKTNYTTITKQLESFAGAYNEAGQLVKAPVSPTWPQLHKLEVELKSNYDRFDLTATSKEGVYKAFAGKVREILHATDSRPELRTASDMLKKTNAWYGEDIAIFKDKKMQMVLDGIRSGEPADPKILHDLLVKEGRSDFAKKAAEMLGPNLTAAIGAADVQEMINLSRKAGGAFDFKKFAGQVLDRENRGMLGVFHKGISEKLIRQMENIEKLEGRLPFEARPGDTVADMIAQAHATAKAVKEAAVKDPLLTLDKEMKQIRQEHTKEQSLARRADQLDSVIYNRTYGANQAVEEIIKKEDLLLAAAQRIEPETFNLIRQVVAERFFRGMDPAGTLAKMSPEVQAIIFPGITKDQMSILAKNWEFLTNQGSASNLGKDIAAQTRVENPARQYGGPIARVLGNIPLGGGTIARQGLDTYYEFINKRVINNLGIARWMEKGLKGDAAAREAVKQEFQRIMQRGGAYGAGIGESMYQTGSGEPPEAVATP